MTTHPPSSYHDGVVPWYHDVTGTTTPAVLVASQAADEGLWFLAATAPEAYLQRALRALHEAIERDALTTEQSSTPEDLPTP